MYAIVEIAGQQFKVQKDAKIFVHRLNAEIGKTIDFDQVLLIDNNGKVTIGAPVVDGAQVSAKVLDHLKGDKVLVFKKKRRKGYQKLNGHRQQFSQILIEEIIEKGGKKAAPKTEAKADNEVKAEAESAKEAAADNKKTAKKEEAPKKAATESKPKAAAKASETEKPKAAAKKAADKKDESKDKESAE